MSIVWRFLVASVVIVLAIPAAFFAVGVLAPATVVSEVDSVVQAPPDRVWPVVTDWRAITAHAQAASGLRRFVSRTVVGGGFLAAGKTVRYTVRTGQTWSQRLTVWVPDRRYAFRNVDAGQGGLMPGDVAMAFALQPEPGGATQVAYTMTVTSHGAFNKAVAYLFGLNFGTLKGYQTLILKYIKAAATHAA